MAKAKPTPAGPEPIIREPHFCWRCASACPGHDADGFCLLADRAEIDARVGRKAPEALARDDLSYQAFIERKLHFSDPCGFEPLWLPDTLFDFQQYLAEWLIRQGRGAQFIDCGLGKSPVQLVWAENVVRHTNRPVLLPTPLGVAPQMVREGEKFGVDCHLSRNGKFPSGARVVVTNYEMLHHFDPADFAGAAGDESGILKNCDGKRRAQITEFFRTLPFRLLSTATPAPNDLAELGTHSEALGDLGYQDMENRFFRVDNRGVHAKSVWGGSKRRFRGHAEPHFYRWICSWARVARRPSDLGFSDARFVLPPLETVEHLVQARRIRSGMLVETEALTREEQLEERRRTLPERCEKAAELLAATCEPGIAWCHLNPEGDLLTRLIPGAVQVTGKDSDERKEEVLLAFTRGEIRKLVTKPTIAGFGLNWQHCAHMTCFPSDSYEQFYQIIRRCWRFGQQRSVRVDLVASKGATGVRANLQRKQIQAERMFAELVRHLNDAQAITRNNPFQTPMEAPLWLS